MARCSTKGCKQGATKRLVTIDQDNNSKGRPIRISCAEQEMHEPQEGITVKIIDVAKKHH